jgi:hypothetical protein
MSTKSKATKSARPSKKASNKVRSELYRARIEITPDTKLAFSHARERGGIKSEFVKLAPRKGAITASKLLALGSKELKVPKARAERWLPGFVRRGVLRMSA